MQILGTGGETLETYNWYPKEYIWPVPDNDGWIDETGALATRTIKNGEGVLIDLVDATTTKVVYSGEVSAEKTEISNTVQGFNWTGNNTPRSISIQDIQLDFGESEASGNDNLQILGTGGETLETYNWYPKEYIWPVPEKDGWIDETGALATKTLTAGQGFLIDIIDPGTKIILPEGYTEKKN